MKIGPRFNAAVRAASIHLICSFCVALLSAALVFGLWYPFPFLELSGGRDLFLMVLAVDVVCGPVLTMVIFNPSKLKKELLRDLSFVALIQVAAFGYGLWTVWDARPLFLVHEIDRFKVIAAPDLRGASVKELPKELQPKWWKGPLTLAIREPKDTAERNKVMFESVQGGRDYAERPEFYLPYKGEEALKSLRRAKPLTVFLQKQSDQKSAARKMALEKGADMAQWLYLPVIGRQDWVAVLNPQGEIQGFLPGDGFQQ